MCSLHIGNSTFSLSRELREEAVLQNLKKRFERDIIYVSITATTLSLLMKGMYFHVFFSDPLSFSDKYR